jgi:hypothetical protein
MVEVVEGVKSSGAEVKDGGIRVFLKAPSRLHKFLPHMVSSLVSHHTLSMDLGRCSFRELTRGRGRVSSSMSRDNAPLLLVERDLETTSRGGE